MIQIYYVEDEKEIANINKLYLEAEGYKVNVFNDIKTALTFAKDKIDLWILDIMFNGSNLTGFDLYTAIKKNNEYVPIIFTSARNSAFDKIKGLQFGADDYVTKPFYPKELILRVKNILNRKRVNNIDEIKIGDYILNISERTLIFEGSSVLLTDSEFKLLHLLIKNINKPLSIETILSENKNTNAKTISVLISNIRKKAPKLTIKNIRNLGYVIKNA